MELWLAKTSKLSLKAVKTDVVHSKQGFSFLGWRFIHLERNKKFYAHIYPSRKALKQISLRIKQVVKQNRASSSYRLIQRLNPVRVGWCNYHKHNECAETFRQLKHIIFGSNYVLGCFERIETNQIEQS